MVCEPLRDADTSAAVHFFASNGFVLFGSQQERLYRHVCEDAVAGRGPVVVVGREEGRVAGAAAAIIDYVGYRRRILLRSPRILASIAVERMRDRFQARGARASFQGPIEVELEPTPPELRSAWSESSSRIAKTAYIGVGPRHRRRGLARRLYETLFSELAHRGVRRLDATIQLHNAASIALHRSLGFRLFDDGDRCLGLKELANE